MAEPIISVRGLSKQYRLGSDRPGHPGLSRFLRRVLRGLRLNESKVVPADNKNDFWALKDITFDVAKGERVGIIGRNGAGKSTLLKILSRVTYPTEGEARIRGRVTSLLEVGTGFNDDLTGRENIYLNASLHGLERAEIGAKLGDIIEFSGIARFIDTPVKHYSSGMRMRLAFSVAAHLDPDILFLDEVLAVGDMSFQRKCLERVDELTTRGRTLLFVSHSMDSIMRYCDRCIWLDSGVVRMDGDVREVVSNYVEAVLDVKSQHIAKQPSPPNVAVDTPESSAREINGNATTENLGTPGVGTPERSTREINSSEPEASFVEAVVVGETSQPTNVVPVSEAVGIRFSYQVTRPGLFVPAISLYSPEGTLVFWSVPASKELESYRLEPGLYESTAWIPKDILNIGVYSVTVAVVDPSQSPMRRHFQLEQIVSFHTLGVINSNDSACGILPREFPGPMRPKLNWKTNDRKYEITSPRFLTEKKVQVSIDTSGFCNARCESCPWPYMRRSKGVIGLDDFKKILARFAGYEFSEFAFNSINEPFADKTILEKVDYFIEARHKTDVLFFSSNWLIPNSEKLGKFVTLVDKAMAASAIRNVSINATISGIDSKSYDVLQAGRNLKGTAAKYTKLDFERAKSNVVQLARALENDIPIDASFVLNLKAYGTELTADQYKDYWLAELIAAGVGEAFLEKRVRFLHNHCFTTFARSGLLSTSALRGRCSKDWLSQKIVIGPDGGVGLCCQEGARRINVGNLVTTSLEQIVAGRAFADQYAVVSGNSPPPTNGHPCRTCEFFIAKPEETIYVA
jgi:lipopolysaccharide transport system ATP-binding protein